MSNQWIRYRFYTYSADDPRPLIFNKHYPWWCSGYTELDSREAAVVVAYLPESENLNEYWDDAFNIDSNIEAGITFTDRFQQPDWYKP